MSSLTVIVLAGGFGTRLQDLHPHIPKPMIPVAGKPFLEWVLHYYINQGATTAIISLGHLAQVAHSHFASHPAAIETVLVTEPQAMGTGGAVRFAAAAPLSDPFLVVNGDSLVVADLSPARSWLQEEHLDGVVLGVRVPDTSRYGSLSIAEDSTLLGFREKQPGAGVINAGVYFFRKRLLDLFPKTTPLSMELDVFPALLAAGSHLKVLAVEAPFLDIGTPQSLAEAEAFIQSNFQ
ncbi:MAG TPA: sugar phosphate nucleotidyltransferase [Bryobacteraceae bacterium]|nr:sugar phosphate nucleotidyltransferase [Bryobacteraceae bacterium]